MKNYRIKLRNDLRNYHGRDAFEMKDVIHCRLLCVVKKQKYDQ